MFGKGGAVIAYAGLAAVDVVLPFGEGDLAVAEEGGVLGGAAGVGWCCFYGGAEEENLERSGRGKEGEGEGSELTGSKSNDRSG